MAEPLQLPGNQQEGILGLNETLNLVSFVIHELGFVTTATFESLGSSPRC